MYEISSFKNGREYCLEIVTPFEKRFQIFPTYAGYKEYLSNFLWHLEMGKKEYITDLEVE